jgi:thymidylate kinase
MPRKPQARQNKLIVIEGLPCAGKTTLVHKIKENLDYEVVPEISELLSEDEFFPGNGTNLKEIIEIAEWFMNKERERTQIAKRLLFNHNVVMDRSYVTSIAYNCAYERYTGIVSAEMLNKKIYEEVHKGNILLPTAFVYLKITPDTMKERRKRKVYRKSAELPDFWMEKRFIDTFISTYESYFSTINVPVKLIDGEKSEDSVYEECRLFLESL